MALGGNCKSSREALQDLLRAVAGYDVVLVRDLDRISRHAPTLLWAVAQLRADGVRLVVVEHEEPTMTSAALAALELMEQR